MPFDIADVPGLDNVARTALDLCGRVDMGAYESGIGDFNCDQAVDLTDFGNWPACMTGPEGGPIDPSCIPFDFDDDGLVDLGDFAGFMNVYTGTSP